MVTGPAKHFVRQAETLMKKNAHIEKKKLKRSAAKVVQANARKKKL